MESKPSHIKTLCEWHKFQYVAYPLSATHLWEDFFYQKIHTKFPSYLFSLTKKKNFPIGKKYFQD